MIALHGFLGLPSDWDVIPCTNGATKLDWLPLLAELPGTPGDAALPALAGALCSATDDDVLLGYSMGGRIAMHMLVQDRRRWRKAVIVSAAPGLAAPAERMGRLEADGRWALRFRRDRWDDVLADWNAQGVFACDGESDLARRESDFNRDHLWLAMLRGSVGRQADLRSALAELGIPVLWLAGERDAKYAALARECAQLNTNFTWGVLEGAGHRAPWTATLAFCDAVSEFLT